MPNQPIKVFISYSHDSEDHKKWVLALSNTLRQHGMDCWIDQYVTFVEEGWMLWMQQQIETADFVLLICTQKYLDRFQKRSDSGAGKGVAWEGAILTQTFYDQFSTNKRFISILSDGGDVKHIPIVLRTYPYFFIPSGYEALLRHLTEQPKTSLPPIGNTPNLATSDTQIFSFGDSLISATAPPQLGDTPEVLNQNTQSPISESNKAELDSDQTFLDHALEKFYHTPALILLAQEYRITPSVFGEIENRLQERFGAANVHHLTPPATNVANPKVYFSLLGKQCGLSQPIQDDAEFESALWDKLQDNESLCFLISRLTKGNDERAHEFASVLRNLLETTHLHVLLCGGQKLAELKFADGSSSLLNCAGVEEWPELTINDVQRLHQQRFRSPLSAEDASVLLTVSGGHPELLHSCLEYHAEKRGMAINANEYSQHLKQEAILITAFARFKKNVSQCQQLCEWLSQLDVAPVQPYLFEDLLREVYWANLLVKRQNRLMWRGEVVREAGQEILTCT